MIRAEVNENGVVLVGDLPSDSFAYLDRDWLPESAGPAPSLVFQPPGVLTWCGGAPVDGPTRADPDTTAALVILAIAQEAAAPVEDLPPSSVEVNGFGLIAMRVRTLVGKNVEDVSERPSAERPRAIVETTGEPGAILDATRRVADLGIVVLVGETLDRRVQIDLYPDVHVRGLTLLGVSPASQLAQATFGRTHTDDRAVQWCRDSLARVEPGGSLPRDAAWYVLSGSS
jgi:hypothetical protein